MIKSYCKLCYDGCVNNAVVIKINLWALFYFFFQIGCPRLFEMGGVISLYKPTTTLQPKVLGFVWCTLSPEEVRHASRNADSACPFLYWRDGKKGHAESAFRDACRTSSALSHCLFPKAMDNQPGKGLSGISGMEQWNGIVEWNTGICIFVSLGYFKSSWRMLCISAIQQ